MFATYMAVNSIFAFTATTIKVKLFAAYVCVNLQV